MKASSGVGGVSVYTSVGSQAMGTARNENNKDRLARMKREKQKGKKKIPPMYKPANYDDMVG
jgi:hypothetical protein